LDQSNKIRAVFGAGFAVLLGLGMAAVYQTFVWENSVTLVARSYESLNKLDGIAYASKAAEAAALRFANGTDAKAATECRQDLADVHALFADLDSVPDGGRTAAFRTLRDRLAEVLSEQSNGLDAALDSTSPVKQLAQLMSVRDASGARLRLQSAVQSLRTVVRQNLDDRVIYQTATAGRARRLFMTAGILCMLLIVLAGWQLSLDFSRREIFGRARARRGEHYRQAVELATDMIVRLDSEGRFTYWNPAALQLLHYAEEEVMGRSFTKLVRLDVRRQVERFYMRQNARNRRNSYYEFPVLDGHGRERWIGLNAQALVKDNEIAGFQAIARDLTERRKLETSVAKRQEFMERLAANTPGILHVFDLADRKTIFANREIAAVLGYKPEDRSNFDQLAMRLFHPDDLSALRAHHDALSHARDGEVLRLEYRARHADGNWVWFSVWESPFTRDPEGRVIQIVGSAQDVSAHHAARERLTWQANYDTLTRLANRQHFWSRLQNLLRRASMEHLRVSLCLFDIDLFKEINDQFGHAAGDEVLESVGTIVRSEMRSEDSSGRVGGDEFCFVLPNADHEEAARLAERIRDRLSTMAFGMNGSGSPFTASATFGIAAWQPNMGARELMEAADRALYRAKSAGRNCVCVDA
jgi:diguanylate cyclase (GGDEF)-like protein/PAS domain S-box-containing protein